MYCPKLSMTYLKDFAVTTAAKYVFAGEIKVDGFGFDLSQFVDSRQIFVRNVRVGAVRGVNL